MVVTGAGPGIMQAAMEGAGRAHSIGVAIRLPFEQGANPVIAGDEKYVSMKYFFTRKLMLVKESRAFVCLPGGFGTLDETFELLTLTQTGKGLPVPIVLLDTPERAVLGADRRPDPRAARRPRARRRRRHQPLPRHRARCEAACAEIDRFYANYHSIRYVGDFLVVRLQHEPDRRPARRAQRALRPPRGAGPHRAQPRRWTSSAATATTSSSRASASPSAATARATCGR